MYRSAYSLQISFAKYEVCFMIIYYTPCGPNVTVYKGLYPESVATPLCNIFTLIR